MICPLGKTSIWKRPPLVSSTTAASRWARPCMTSSCFGQAVDIRHLTLGWAMTRGASSEGCGRGGRHAARLGDESASLVHPVSLSACARTSASRAALPNARVARAIVTNGSIRSVGLTRLGPGGRRYSPGASGRQSRHGSRAPGHRRLRQHLASSTRRATCSTRAATWWRSATPTPSGPSGGPASGAITPRAVLGLRAGAGRRGGRRGRAADADLDARRPDRGGARRRQARLGPEAAGRLHRRGRPHRRRGGQGADRPSASPRTSSTTRRS